MLSKFGMSWISSSTKTYVVGDGEKKILTGIYASKDDAHKIMMVYLGKDNPTMMIYKASGSGGMFLIELMSLCHKVGCSVKDESLAYVEDILLRIGKCEDVSIDIESENDSESDGGKKDRKNKKKSASEDVGVTLLDFGIDENSERINKYTNKILEEFINDRIWLYELRGIDIEVVKKFRKREIEKNVAWAVEHKFLV